TPPAIENPQQVATVLEERNRQPAKPRRQVSHEIDRLLNVDSFELMRGNGVKVWKDILVGLDHLDLDRILLPTLMRHVGVDLVEDQMTFVLIVNGCRGERRQQRTLRLGAIVTKRVDKKVNSISQIFTSLFREACDQCDRRLNTVPIGSLNALTSFIQI